MVPSTRAETDLQQVPPEREEELHCAGDWALGQAAQRGCAVSLTGEPSGGKPVPCAVGGMTLLEQRGWSSDALGSLPAWPILGSGRGSAADSLPWFSIHLGIRQCGAAAAVS